MVQVKQPVRLLWVCWRIEWEGWQRGSKQCASIPRHQTQDVQQAQWRMFSDRDQTWKDLLHLACWQHVPEVIPGDVFKHSFGPSSGPDMACFKRFHENWPHMDTDNFKTTLQDLKPALRWPPRTTCSEIVAAHSKLRLDAIEFAKNSLHFSWL